MAFLSDRVRTGQLQLYVVGAAGGAGMRVMTNLKGALAMPRWSPDGKLVALLFTESAPGAPGPLESRRPDTGVVEEHIYEQRLIVVDPHSGHVRFISPPDLYVYEYDWSPDGKTFVVIGAHGAGDDNWWIAQLCTIASESLQTRLLLKRSVQIARPRWSPDGKHSLYRRADERCNRTGW
jgi:Tol biopolymer transport system component